MAFRGDRGSLASCCHRGTVEPRTYRSAVVATGGDRGANVGRRINHLGARSLEDEIGSDAGSDAADASAAAADDVIASGAWRGGREAGILSGSWRIFLESQRL